MIALTAGAIATLTGGRLFPEGADPNVLVEGPVVTDSRLARPGGLYIARVGEQADGHDFVAAAAELGALLSLTTRPVGDYPCVVVGDTQDAFVALARATVDAVPDLTIIGITGSSGKTSTKDLLGQVLASHGETIAPEGSFNSEVGVPLTVCRVERSTRYLVVEMGARGVGHVEYLTRIAPPRIGVVLNVGVAHVGEFGSREAIAIAKRELVEALPPAGLAVLNADDPVVAAMAAYTHARVILVGESETAAIRAVDVAVDPQGRAIFTARTPVGDRTVHLALIGRHHVGNALAALAVALECGMDLESACSALESATPISRWRMELTRRADGVLVVNDAYNANPDSMRVALDSLAHLGGVGRTWAVLGTMLELGEDSEEMHAEVGRYAAEQGISDLIAVADGAEQIARGAEAHGGIRVHRAVDAEAAEVFLAEELGPGDVVLFKSSRNAGLRWLGDRVAGRQVSS